MPIHICTLSTHMPLISAMRGVVPTPASDVCAGLLWIGKFNYTLTLCMVEKGMKIMKQLLYLHFIYRIIKKFLWKQIPFQKGLLVVLPFYHANNCLIS